jgi:uncharacterized RDD family membrane protein YckC
VEWYYAQGEDQLGPVSESEFEALVESGAITAETYVWNADWTDWQRFGEVTIDGKPVPAEELFSENLFVDTQEVTCVECGESKPPDDVLQFQGLHVCATCKPIFFQRVQQGTLQLHQQRFAGFWIRFVAKFIDSVLTGSIAFAFAGAMTGFMGTEMDVMSFFISIFSSIFGFVIDISYKTYLIGRFGATLGKMACGLEVIVGDGSPVSFPRALGRAFAEMISGMILYIGYIMAGFDDQKRSLHDMICDTRVVYTARD